MRLAYRLAQFAGSLLLVHLMLGTLAWAMAWFTRRALPESRTGQRAWTCLWMIMAMIWILAANAAWFPSSSLGHPYAGVVQASIVGFSIFDFLSFALAAAVGTTIACLVWRHRAVLALPRPAVFGSAAIVLLCTILAARYPQTVWSPARAAPLRPNIILVGLDSVRADVANAGEGHQVPALSGFLRRATIFADTITPLARTFGAWVSILTGRHPHTTGAIINLMPRDLVETGETLPDLLRDAGYETIYATDEVRFSNVDQSYGFDRTIGPRIGSADFLIEFFGDTPLSNLLVNTRLGDLLFPELHGNRAAKVLYHPDTFVRDLDRNLYFESPTFLVVHLALPHWPYTFSTSEPRQRGRSDSTQYPDLHAAAVERVDRQFADLMVMLELKGALDNAIVVLLSDHGESLGETSPLADASGSILPLPGDASIYGHGTHVFSDEQYKVLLGFRTYGDAPMPLGAAERILAPASLEDVAPTILDALDLTSRDLFDGRSLLPLLSDDYSEDPTWAEPRIRFLETEFNPPGVDIGQTLTASAMARASASYRIDPLTDRVEIHPEELGRILDVRQYAALLDDHLLASVPASDPRNQHLVYVGPSKGAAVWLDAPPSADGTPMQRQLWNALRTRFDAVADRPVVAVSPDE
jgi:hypothetical protein